MNTLKANALLASIATALNTWISTKAYYQNRKRIEALEEWKDAQELENKNRLAYK